MHLLNMFQVRDFLFGADLFDFIVTIRNLGKST
jgi:hypothetical protein